VEGHDRQWGALRRAALLVGAQALVLLVLAVVLVVHGVAFDPEDRTGTLLLALCAAVAGALVAVVARGLDRARGWAWSPTVLIQVFLAVFSVGAVQSRAWVAAVPAGLLVLAVAYQLALPDAREARGQRGG
jgi:hypothetical protein